MNQGITELDVHGMTTYQAKICISSSLKKAKSDIYVLRIIHGFHSGTKIKEMIRKEFKGNPKVKRIEVSMNQGITDLILRDLF